LTAQHSNENKDILAHVLYVQYDQFILFIKKWTSPAFSRRYIYFSTIKYSNAPAVWILNLSALTP